MTEIKDLHEKWMKNPEYREHYEATRSLYAVVSGLIKARMAAGLTQEEVAARMNTKQPGVARLESFGSDPRLSTLVAYAKAVRAKLNVVVEPKPARQSRTGTRSAAVVAGRRKKAVSK